MRPGLSFALVLLAIIACTAAVLELNDFEPVGSTEAADLPRHELDVWLTPDNLDVKLDEYNLGTCTFGGNVTVEKVQGVERTTVTLSAECNKGWPVVLSRQTMVFIDSETQRFQLSVVVPPATRIQRGTVTVHAVADSPIWHDEDSHTANVTVLQYVNVNLWTDAMSYEGKPGDTVGGKLFVNNSGNGEDTFLISLEDADKLKGTFKGWVFEEAVTVPPGFYSEVYFTFDVREDFDVPSGGRTVTVHFRVESTKGNELRTPKVATLPVYIIFKGLTQVLKENWPTYVGVGAGVAVLIAIPAFVLIKRRRRADEELELSLGTAASATNGGQRQGAMSDDTRTG